MKKSILIVDDDQSVNSIFEFILQQAGYTTHTASSGEDCLKVINDISPIDLIFLDIRLPGISGIETLKKIQEKSPSLNVIMMTGNAIDETIEESFDRGAYGVIYKPFDVEEVLSIVDKIFSEKPKG